MDVAHLILYHLSICCKKKYFDFEREILPFASENWDSLLLGEVRAMPGGGAEPPGSPPHGKGVFLLTLPAEELGTPLPEALFSGPVEGPRPAGLTNVFPPRHPQLSDTPKGERYSQLLNALTTHKDR